VTLKTKLRLLFCVFFLLFDLRAAAETSLPAVEKVVQQKFPAKWSELQKTTDSLWREYREKENIISLIFYSYGMLKLANHYNAINDLVNAAEYAKLGFFYLDEAVDLYENDLRVRYLRARVDAWLPGSLGRCIIAINDTELLLKSAVRYGKEITDNINYMRYHALKSCKEDKQADALLAQIAGNKPKTESGSPESNAASEWDVSEVRQIILPLVRDAHD